MSFRAHAASCMLASLHALPVGVNKPAPGAHPDQETGQPLKPVRPQRPGVHVAKLVAGGAFLAFRNLLRFAPPDRHRRWPGKPAHR